MRLFWGVLISCCLLAGWIVAVGVYVLVLHYLLTAR